MIINNYLILLIMLTKELVERYLRSRSYVRLPTAAPMIGASCCAPPSTGEATQGLPQDFPPAQFNHVTCEQMRAAPEVFCGDRLTRVGNAERFMQKFATQGKFVELVKKNPNTRSFNYS